MDTTDATFQQCAIAADAQSQSPLSCAELWRSLRDGELHVLSSLTTPERSLLVLEKHPVGDWQRKLQGRRLQIVEHLSLGVRPKALAIDLAIAPSTITATLKDALSALGFASTPPRMPLSLVMIVRSAFGGDCVRGGKLAAFEWAGRHLVCVGVPRLEEGLKHVLSPAEYEAASLLIAGESHASIATQRHTSRRTIANQLSAAFRRLGISGRGDLLQRVVAQPSELGGGR